MRKRDRTRDEKQFDKLLKTGIKLLGGSPNPVRAEVPADPFTHVLRWGMLGRKGQSCKIVSSGIPFSTIEFEDGFRRVVDNRAIVRRAPCSSSSSSCSLPTSSSPS